ncbi:FAD-dependent monooxygenase [Allokutzneria sp. NRRL B-24872]|uniref:FAD-dependent monooxygenase n=1 Tax=Allokutzneria sp. NRRL B-24872 TaxID=1137961 RepID=UPI000A3CABEC|nr:FAD-dependent monooxygenase [Allokutzneria sp. NRRL B-24872]
MSDVMISGAGPTGLVLALDLARRGIAVRVLERSPRPQTGSRGKTLHARSVEIMADLGVGPRIAEIGTASQKYRKYFNGEHVSDSAPFGESTLFLTQTGVEEALREQLATHGVHVEFGAELTGFTQAEDRVVVELADGRTAETGYLIGCDGGRSTVRRLLGLAFVGESAQEQSMICGDVEVDGLDREYWHQWVDDEGAFMLCPFRGTSAWQVQTAPEFTEDGSMIEPSLESFQRRFERHARVRGLELRNATWLSSWRINVRMVEQMRVGRVLLAGDSAHVHPIAGGLGMNTGIQDAWNLGWKLALVASGRANGTLLDTYQEERLPIAAWTLNLSTERLDAAMAKLHVPGTGLDTVAVTEVSGLGINYRWSSLAGQSLGVLQAGDRAPTGSAAGPLFTVLGFGESGRAGQREVADAHPDLVRAGAGAEGFGIEGDAVALIRPDHHIAVISTDADPVLKYLAELFN